MNKPANVLFIGLPGSGKTTFLAALMSIAAIVNASGNHAGWHDHSDAAIGEPGDATRITRTVRVDMTDTMCFMPAQITVQRGETIAWSEMRRYLEARVRGADTEQPAVRKLAR